MLKKEKKKTISEYPDRDSSVELLLMMFRQRGLIGENKESVELWRNILGRLEEADIEYLLDSFSKIQKT